MISRRELFKRLAGAVIGVSVAPALVKAIPPRIGFYGATPLVWPDQFSGGRRGGDKSLDWWLDPNVVTTRYGEG